MQRKPAPTQLVGGIALAAFVGFLTTMIAAGRHFVVVDGGGAESLSVIIAGVSAGIAICATIAGAVIAGLTVTRLVRQNRPAI